VGTNRSTRIVAVVVASLAIVAGTAAAPASAFSSNGCSASPHSSTPFAAWGDATPYVLAPGGGVSLADGQSLTTDCVRVPKPQPIVRFFAQSTGGTGSLHVELLVTGTRLVLDGGLVSAPATMGPVAQLVILPVGLRFGALPLQVRITAVGGTFNIGDVYIDPYVQRSANL
jgi:hypothetical protein